MSASSSSGGGMGVGGVLFCIFVTLKLTGHIDWSWWWVTSPLWISFGLVLLGLALVVVYMLIGESRADRRWKRKERAEW